jgi:hypothetical protein
MEINLPIIAGFISTALFTLGTLPMLTKAFRTRNLASYSLGNILMSNVGNLIYAIYRQGPSGSYMAITCLARASCWSGISDMKAGHTRRAHPVIMPPRDSCQHFVAPRQPKHDYFRNLTDL